MMEQMPSSQDLYVSRVARKMREAEKEEKRSKERAEKSEKEALTERIIDRIGEISKMKVRLTDDALRTNSHTERMAVLAHLFELQTEERQMQNVFDRIIKPSREELMYGDEPISDEEHRLLEKETPFLLVGGKRPLLDVPETGVEMELEDRDVQELTEGGTVIEEQDTVAKPRLEALGEVPFYRVDAESVVGPSGRPEHVAVEDMPVMLTKRKSKKETTGTKTRITAELSEENIDIEAIDRKAMSMPPRKREEYYQAKRDKVLETLSNVIAHPTERSEAEQEQLVNRLESRFQVLQARVNRAKSTPDRNDSSQAA